MNRMFKSLSTIALIFSAGCIVTEAPPNATTTVDVEYGDKVFVADPSTTGPCGFAGPFESSGDGINITFFPDSAASFQSNERRAHNCYVPVQPGKLATEIVPVSNLQYQLCVDSDVCERPDPIDQDPGDHCTNADEFYSCPIVSVSHFEARRYCDFIGRRLPSNLEHAVFRTNGALIPGTTTASGTAVPEVPREGGIPDPGLCDNAVLDGCGNSPSPMALEDPENPIGAGRADTLGGLYDLTGNVREWSSDLFEQRAPSLPWFCAREIPGGQTGDGSQPVTDRDCPAGEICVYGRIRMADGSINEEWPVCIAHPGPSVQNGLVAGTFGTGYNHTGMRRYTTIGPFTRRDEGILSSADAIDANVQGKGLGFRCVGIPGDDVNGVIQLRQGP